MTVLIIKGVRESTNKSENQKEKTNSTLSHTPDTAPQRDVVFCVAEGPIDYRAFGVQNTKTKQYDTASDDDDASVVDEANAYAEGSVFRSQAGAGSAVDDPGGGIDDPGGGDIDDLGSLDNLATSTTTSSKTSVSFVSSSLTTGFSLMSLSDKSAVDATRLGGRRWYMDDCATGSFCSSCAIPPRVAGGLWSDGVGCDACCYPFGVLCRGCG